MVSKGRRVMSKGRRVMSGVRRRVVSEGRRMVSSIDGGQEVLMEKSSSVDTTNSLSCQASGLPVPVRMDADLQDTYNLGRDRYDW